MPKERSAGAIIFIKEGDKILYLLLKYRARGKVEKTYWGFPKGHIEKGETELETAKREAKEETGIEELEFIDGFKERERYFFCYQNKTIFKEVIYFLAETKTKKIKISFEHLNYQWLPYKKALEVLSFENAKEILKKANQFLQKKGFRSGEEN